MIEEYRGLGWLFTAGELVTPGAGPHGSPAYTLVAPHTVVSADGTGEISQVYRSAVQRGICGWGVVVVREPSEVKRDGNDPQAFERVSAAQDIGSAAKMIRDAHAATGLVSRQK